MSTDKSKEMLDAALSRLYERRQFGIKLGLDPVRRMCELLGNPEKEFGVIHVAGTNGKGSVSAIIASIAQASGLKVGLYTSPHLVRFNERIRINGIDVSDADLVDALTGCEEAASKMQEEQDHEATFFEITTVLAFECFRRAGVRLAVVETGLGGRLDATNVVMPLVSVITRVAEDHRQYLGDTLEAIAAEKGGIIKAGRPVVVAPQESAVMETLNRIAIERESPLAKASEIIDIERVSGTLLGQKVRFESTSGLSGTAACPLLGDHQLENIGVALAATELLFDQLGVQLGVEAVKKGISGVRWPGRCELLRETPCMIIDAAHNPSGADALVKALKRNGVRHVGMVIGMCGDKDVDGVVRILAPIARRAWVVPLSDARSADQQMLSEKLRGHGVQAEALKLDAALEAAEAWGLSEKLPIVITGSIFLLGDVLKAL